MRVCDVVLNSIWYDPRVRKQIASYIENGIELVCIGRECGRYDQAAIAQIPCKTNVVMRNRRYYGKQCSIIKKVMREIVRVREIRDAIIAEKPDIIHANDLDALIPGYLAKRKLNCKLIYDSHEVNTENVYYNDKKLYAFFVRQIERYICQRIDLMICVSHAAAEYFSGLYHIAKPTVITNCALRAEQCISVEKHGGFEVLNHGQFYEGRGYDIMIEALPYLRDYPEIKLAVRGFGKLEQSMRERVSELGGDNFRFYPKVKVEELISMAAVSMVGVAITEAVCLNFELSVSNKLFEYAAAGLPIIMSDIPEHRYLNEKYHFGIVIPDNKPETFAEAVIKLYTDKELYNECANNARRLSKAVNWENEFEKLICFEKKLISEK